MNEHIGQWHTVTVEADDSSSSGLDFDITHPADCPTDEDNWFDPYACDMANELGYAGFDHFDITEPGTYRARFRCWEYPSNPISGGPEYDSAVEVERVIV